MSDLNELPKDERFAALRQNKAALINAKLADKKFSEPVIAVPSIKPKEIKTKAKKAEPVAGDDAIDEGVIDVTVVCNSAWFIDSQMDVLTDKAYDRAVSDSSMVHIHDHEWECTAHVGDVKQVYKQAIPLAELGLNQEGNTIALLMDSTIRRDYNDKVFSFYQKGKINQHSIGLRYLDIRLAMDSPDPYDAAEKALWDKTYPKLINQAKADERGYFWVVDDAIIYENSCVLFGANALTPTLATSNLKLDTPKEKGTQMTEEQLKALFTDVAKAIGDAVTAANQPVLAELGELKTALAASANNGSLTEALSKMTEAVEKSNSATTEMINTISKMPLPQANGNLYGVVGAINEGLR